MEKRGLVLDPQMLIDVYSSGALRQLTLLVRSDVAAKCFYFDCQSSLRRATPRPSGKA